MVGRIEENNKYLINAPAGSGKTTYIRDMLKRIGMDRPESRILCITYTNRAAEELKKDLENKNITISTIHSYINNLISPFYSTKEALDLYWEIYRNKINERIKNVEKDSNIGKSNQYYIEKYGKINEDVVRENLLELSYGETSFTSLYMGKLSHDDLLMFANKFIKRYPVLLRKIRNKYNYIFIDEYQDTSAYVLDLFYDAVKSKKDIELYLCGDRMQQIYKNYDGSFEQKLKEFNTTYRLEINFRSIDQIVSILNRIYNDVSFLQQSSNENKNAIPDIMPQVIITSNVHGCICELQKEFPDILTLYLMNKEKYEEIGAGNLYEVYKKMEKYSFGKKYFATDILSDISSDNPDILMRFLFLLNSIMDFYENENYGMVISLCKKASRYFDSSQFKIKKHNDKERIKNKLDKIQIEYEKDGSLIRNVIESLFESGFISEAVKNEFEESTEYQPVLDIPIIEVKKLASYLKMPHISTQHGVKGESHSSVIFMASDNNNNPNVRMYSFFEMWSKLDFSLPKLETLFYSYSRVIEKVEAELGMKTNKLTKEKHNENEKNREILLKYSKEVLETYQGNILFDTLCKQDFVAYLTKQNVSNAKKIFTITKIEGILAAYKLFYVGCSRARKNLVVVVDENNVRRFKEDFVKKMEEIGFLVLCK